MLCDVVRLGDWCRACDEWVEFAAMVDEITKLWTSNWSVAGGQDMDKYVLLEQGDLGRSSPSRPFQLQLVDRMFQQPQMCVDWASSGLSPFVFPVQARLKIDDVRSPSTWTQDRRFIATQYT